VNENPSYQLAGNLSQNGHHICSVDNNYSIYRFSVKQWLSIYRFSEVDCFIKQWHSCWWSRYYKGNSN